MSPLVEEKVVIGDEILIQIIRWEWTSSNSRISYESLLLDNGRGSLDKSSGEWKAEEKGQIANIT